MGKKARSQLNRMVHSIVHMTASQTQHAYQSLMKAKGRPEPADEAQKRYAQRRAAAHKQKAAAIKAADTRAHKASADAKKALRRIKRKLKAKVARLKAVAQAKLAALTTKKNHDKR